MYLNVSRFTAGVSTTLYHLKSESREKKKIILNSLTLLTEQLTMCSKKVVTSEHTQISVILHACYSLNYAICLKTLQFNTVTVKVFTFAFLLFFCMARIVRFMGTVKKRCLLMSFTEKQHLNG